VHVHDRVTSGLRRTCLAGVLAYVAVMAVMAATAATAAASSARAADPFPSTYAPGPARDTLIVNATILDGLGGRVDGGSLLLSGGKVRAIGIGIEPPEGVLLIDGTDRWVTPGIIDVHSHLGMAVVPYTPIELATWDVNELTDPNTAHVRAEHAVQTQDPSFSRALAGGVTTLHILPGSANLFGGQGVVLKNVPALTVQAMKFPDAPRSLKMACGENPKYTYGPRQREPFGRMGIVAAYRAAWEAASVHRRAHADQDDVGERLAGGESAPRDFRLETLADVLDGEVRVHIHCYRADEMAVLIDVAREYDFRITAFHHASEAYKIPELLSGNGICAVVWADWWGFKMEALDGIRENAAFLEAAGACVALHSDSAIVGQRLNIEAAKAVAAGRRAGIELSHERAIRWLTGNPARILGLEDRIGALAPGMNADVVLWSGDPFSIRTRADLVLVDGAVAYDRADPPRDPWSDFELGQPGLQGRP
jgi:imidazolonepropionase-like amidohydrolase